MMDRVRENVKMAKALMRGKVLPRNTKYNGLKATVKHQYMLTLLT